MLTIDNYNMNSSVAFTGGPKSAKELRNALEKSVKEAKKVIKSNSSNEDKQKAIDEVINQAKETEGQAKTEAAEKIAKSKFGTKLDKTLDNIFTWVVSKFGKSDKLAGKNKSSDDIVKAVTRVVLLGNTFKEVVGTILYTTQAMTNEDLPKDKRKFVGLYDLSVGVVSTIVSLIFGVGLQDRIRNGYSKLLKPLGKSLPKSAAFVGTAAAFTSFALQTIVGKRIIAPAIATPVAGKLKAKMMEKEDNAKAVQKS